MLMPNDALLAPRKTILVTAVMFASLAPFRSVVQTGPIDENVRTKASGKNNNLNAVRPILMRIKVIAPEAQGHDD